MKHSMMKAVKIGDDFGIFYNHQLDNVSLTPTGDTVSISGVTYPLYEPDTTALPYLIALSLKVGSYPLDDYIV